MLSDTPSAQAKTLFRGADGGARGRCWGGATAHAPASREGPGARRRPDKDVVLARGSGSRVSCADHRASPWATRLAVTADRRRGVSCMLCVRHLLQLAMGGRLPLESSRRSDTACSARSFQLRRSTQKSGIEPITPPRRPSDPGLAKSVIDGGSTTRHAVRRDSTSCHAALQDERRATRSAAREQNNDNQGRPTQRAGSAPSKQSASRCAAADFRAIDAWQSFDRRERMRKDQLPRLPQACRQGWRPCAGSTSRKAPEFVEEVSRQRLEHEVRVRRTRARCPRGSSERVWAAHLRGTGSSSRATLTGRGSLRPLLLGRSLERIDYRHVIPS
jgi:hypothetical protein